MYSKIKLSILCIFLIVIPAITIYLLPESLAAIPLLTIFINTGLWMASFLSFLGIISPRYFSYYGDNSRGTSAFICLCIILISALLFLPYVFFAIASAEYMGKYREIVTGAFIYGPVVATLPIFLRWGKQHPSTENAESTADQTDGSELNPTGTASS